jgi:hypothetical protein
VVQWSAILLPSEPLFDNLPPLRIAAVIYFAVFDLVAAVGLWPATPWGGVIGYLVRSHKSLSPLHCPVFSMLWVVANLSLAAIFCVDLEGGRAGAALVKLRHWRNKP